MHPQGNRHEKFVFHAREQAYTHITLNPALSVPRYLAFVWAEENDFERVPFARFVRQRNARVRSAIRVPSGRYNAAVAVVDDTWQVHITTGDMHERFDRANAQLTLCILFALAGGNAVAGITTRAGPARVPARRANPPPAVTAIRQPVVSIARSVMEIP